MRFFEALPMTARIIDGNATRFPRRSVAKSLSAPQH